MDNKYTTYTNPLTDRYCSKDMSYIFSPQFKFSTWRKLWVALAEGEKELGINITEEQLDELRNNIDNIKFNGLLETTTIFPIKVNDNAIGIINVATAYPKTSPIGIPIIDNFNACLIIILFNCFEVVPIVFNKP